MDVAVFRTVWRGRNIQLCITNMVHATSRSLAIHAGKFARDVAAGKYDKARRHKRKEGV
jgi:hypothetical protein